MHSTADLSGLLLHMNESEFVSGIPLRSALPRDRKLLMKSHTGESNTILGSIPATQI